MGDTKQIQTTPFAQAIQKGVTLVDFNAPWCAPCRVQKPIVEQLSQKFKDRAAVIEINVDENRTAAMQLGVTSIPTMVVFHNGTEIHRYVGLQPAGVLADALDEALSLAKAKENAEAPDIT